MHTIHVHVPDRSFAGMKTILDIAQENEWEMRQCRNPVLMTDDPGGGGCTAIYGLYRYVPL